MDLLATEKGNKHARNYLSPGKCGCYLIWNIPLKKKKRFNSKYSGILRMTWTEKCLLPKPIYKWQHVAMLAKGETRRHTMAPNSAVLFAGSLLWMHNGRNQLQITTDCFYVSFCLSPPAVPLSLPSSPPLQACSGARTSCRRELPSALLLKMWAVDSRVDGQLHRLPYFLAGASCWGHVSPLFTGDKRSIISWSV